MLTPRKLVELEKSANTLSRFVSILTKAPESATSNSKAAAALMGAREVADLDLLPEAEDRTVLLMDMSETIEEIGAILLLENMAAKGIDVDPAEAETEEIAEEYTSESVTLGMYL